MAFLYFYFRLNDGFAKICAVVTNQPNYAIYLPGEKVANI